MNDQDIAKTLLDSSSAASLVDLGYRFCRHEPGIDVVLTGTGDTAHLRANIASITDVPLEARKLRALEQMFGRVDCITGE